MQRSFADMIALDAEQVRQHIRSGAYRGHTAGLGRDRLQANLAIISQDHARDFFRFCQRNPKPCPVVGVSETGEPVIHTLGSSIDLRTDLPAYFVYREGALAGSAMDILDLWRSDFVAFALGCSFTFEHALKRAGFTLWHISNDTTVPMFRTNLPTIEVGPFGGPMVVSMRAIPRSRLDEAIEISAGFPQAHGAPVHWGDPAKIGVQNLGQPDWGDPAPVGPGEVPVFWACGVTPQAAIQRARLPICITHKPGHMLITDIGETDASPVMADHN